MPPQPIEAGRQRNRQARRAGPRRRAVPGRKCPLQRDHPDLGGERDGEQDEGGVARPGGQPSGGARPVREREAARLGGQERERREQRRAADLRQSAGQVAGDEGPRPLAVRAGQQVDAHGERLPREIEEERVVGADRHRDEEQQRGMQRGEPTTGRQLGVGERYRGAGHAGEREEDPREAVRAQGAGPEAQPAAELQRRRRPAECRRYPDRHQAGTSGRGDDRPAARAPEGGRDRHHQRAHGQREDQGHAMAPTASSSPWRMAIGAGGEPGT
jgi:hypothetical protein